MKTLKNPKELKPCLNCVLSGGSRFIDTHICPCPNFSGEIQIDKGKITSFRCENRKMHRGFPNTPETHSKARRAKQGSKVS